MDLDQEMIHLNNVNNMIKNLHKMDNVSCADLLIGPVNAFTKTGRKSTQNDSQLAGWLVEIL